MFLGLGLGQGRQGQAKVSAAANVAGTLSSKDFQTAKVAGDARQPARGDLEAVLAALRDLRRPASNAELAAIMGCSEGEASKRAKACGGAIVKEREGRTVRLSLPQQLH